ncbi:MAG: hypothetical protein PHV34_13540 [Verrucomicrobiae bacterium]|nr:hypothetical protein [Verrucomicrobiae bacterium]
MFRFLRRLILIMILLAAGVVLARNMIGIWAAQALLKRQTGFSAFIGSLDIKLTRAEVTVLDIGLRNPRTSFREPRAAEIRRMDIFYSPWALMRGQFHMVKVKLDVFQWVLVRNEAGELNFSGTSFAKEGRHGNDGARSSKAGCVSMDEVAVSVDEGLYIDEKNRNGEPALRKLALKDIVFREIKSPEDLHRAMGGLIEKCLVIQSKQNVPPVLKETARPRDLPKTSAGGRVKKQ